MTTINSLFQLFQNSKDAINNSIVYDRLVHSVIKIKSHPTTEQDEEKLFEILEMMTNHNALPHVLYYIVEAFPDIVIEYINTILNQLIELEKIEVSAHLITDAYMYEEKIKAQLELREQLKKLFCHPILARFYLSSSRLLNIAITDGIFTLNRFKVVQLSKGIMNYLHRNNKNDDNILGLMNDIELNLYRIDMAFNTTNFNILTSNQNLQYSFVSQLYPFILEVLTRDKNDAWVESFLSKNTIMEEKDLYTYYEETNKSLVVKSFINLFELISQVIYYSESGDLVTVQTLLEKIVTKPDVDTRQLYTTNHLSYLFIYLANYKDPEIAFQVTTWLLENSIPNNKMYMEQTNFFSRAFLVACKNNLPLVTLYLNGLSKYGYANVDVSFLEYAAIHVAVKHENIDIINQVLSHCQTYPDVLNEIVVFLFKSKPASLVLPYLFENWVDVTINNGQLLVEAAYAIRHAGQNEISIKRLQLVLDYSNDVWFTSNLLSTWNLALELVKNNSQAVDIMTRHQKRFDQQIPQVEEYNVWEPNWKQDEIMDEISLYD
jgi:hypothetical protein